MGVSSRSGVLPLAVVLIAAACLVGCHAEREAAVSTTACSPCQAGLRGDLNGSGLPDITDAVGILRIIVGLDPANALADCDCDDLTGITDAIALLRCLVGLAPWPIPCTGETTNGSDGQTLVWVGGGSFMMGSDEGLEQERPVHRVTMDGFWIGQCEVTNAQYRAFCDATGRTFPPESGEGDDHPVEYVNREDAWDYCQHYGYALPTEAQWEYAARGPAAPAYPWGDEWDEQKCCNWFNEGPTYRTFPVGSFPTGASWCGALDMAGNVWEWCADRYDPNYYDVSPELNPPGPQEEEGQPGVLRGGSLSSFEFNCRAAFRCCDFYPVNTLSGGGFRVVKAGG